MILALLALDSADAAPKPVMLGPAATGELVPVGGTLFFKGFDNRHRSGLWRTDGTRAGTRPVTRTRRPRFRNPEFLTEGAGMLFFRAGRHGVGRELWRSDGTKAGTRLVRDILPGAEASGVGSLTEVGREVFFTARDDLHGKELWRSDGTRAGTALVADLVPGTRSASPEQLTEVEGALYLSTSKPDQGLMIWKVDPRADGPELIGSFPQSHAVLAGVGEELYFVLWTADGDQLWKTDGTGAGTELVQQLNSGLEYRVEGNQLADVQGSLLFSADDGVHGSELWRSDGTSAGTSMLKDSNPVARASGPDWLTSVGATLYFSASDGVHGAELWKSDGTPGGTVMVKNISARGSSYVWNPVGYRGEVFFGASDDRHGSEPWRSDGTRAGTRRIADLVPGKKGSLPDSFAAARGKLFFSASRPGVGYVLWRFSL